MNRPDAFQLSNCPNFARTNTKNWFKRSLISFLLLSGALFLTQGCSSSEEAPAFEAPVPPGKRLKEGLHNSYHSNGKVKSAVIYQAGKKHGVSKLYYENGNLQLEIPYENGSREGTSKKYYQTGQLYAETPYVSNKVNGIRTTYYTNGNVKATTPYENNLIGMGVVEYSPEGVEVPPNHMIVRKDGDGRYKITTGMKCRKTVFFEGKLVNGQYLDEKKLVPLAMSGDTGLFVKIDPGQPSNIICQCKTSKGNTVVMQQKI